MSKEYGLIIPGKKKPVEPPKFNFTKPSIFGSDSDSDGGPPTVLPKMKANPMCPGATERRKARAIHEKALAENPTIFQYDELYDEIENKRQEEKNAKSNEVKKPKYIQHLLQHAERRKLENERRVERMVQKEREAEGEQFKDKESYVTAAYRKKLEELQKAEEQEMREDYLESIGDVTKQQDLGGFYRHLYEQKLGPKETKLEDNAESKELENLTNISIPKVSKPRTYRKRQSSDEENEQESVLKNTAAKSHIQSNLDADSDFSIDSSSDSEDNETNIKKDKKVEKITEKTVTEKKIKLEKSESEPEKQIKTEKLENVVETKTDNSDKNQKPTEKTEDLEKENIPKIDIWKKRTVGAAFEEAVQRYYERKAERSVQMG